MTLINTEVKNEVKKPNMKILWAIDAFDDAHEDASSGVSRGASSGDSIHSVERAHSDLPGLQAEAALILSQVSAHCITEIEPVYVLSPEQMGITIEVGLPWGQHYAPSAKKTLEQKLKQVRLAGLKEPQILLHHRSSLRGTVEVLSRYARTNHFDLILVGSHSRRGLERALLGSFAEELLLQSEVPVMVIGARVLAKPLSPPDHILFPTDFSETSYSTYREILKLAQSLKAKITLLHVIPRPAEAMLQSGVYLLSGNWVPVPIYIEREQAQHTKTVEKWEKEALKLGIQIKLIIDSDTPSVVQSIRAHAISQRVSVIAMAAQSGRMKSMILGSVSRQIVREASCPVWISRDFLKEEYPA